MLGKKILLFIFQVRALDSQEHARSRLSDRSISRATGKDLLMYNPLHCCWQKDNYKYNIIIDWNSKETIKE